MDSILKNTSRINIELSNLCNYAAIHKKCPLHLADTPTILPGKIVRHVLEFLGANGFTGKVAFHTYNEPGIDPRLFLFIKYARDYCPSSHIFIMSNGYYIDENLLDEFKEAGADEVMLSAYTETEYRRFSSYKTKIKLSLSRPRLDTRIDLYDRDETNLKDPCYAPLNELIITREGYVGLCCLDWRREVVFGNLHKETLKDVLENPKLRRAYEKLSCGDRFYNICKRCNWSR